MGLGKTLTLLALVCLSLDKFDGQKLPSGTSGATLIITPKSSKFLMYYVLQREDSDGRSYSRLGGTDYKVGRGTVTMRTGLIGFRHIHPGQVRYLVYHGPKRRETQQALSRDYDIVITTYDTLLSDWRAGSGLHSEIWYRVALDEGKYDVNGESYLSMIIDSCTFST